MKNRKNGGFIGVNAPLDTIRPDGSKGVLSTDELLTARSKGFNSPEFISRYPETISTSQIPDSEDPYYNYVFSGLYSPLVNTSIVTDQSNRWNAFLEPYSTANGRFETATMQHQTNTFWSNRFTTRNQQVVTVTDRADLRFGTGPFTIEFWYKRTHRNAANRFFFNKGSSTGPTGWQVGINSSFQIFFSDVNTTTTAAYALKHDLWYHVAIVREGTGSNQLKIYINGTVMGVGTSSSNFTQTENLVIGQDRAGTAANRLAGFITDIRMSNVAVYTSNTCSPVEVLTNTSNTVFSSLATDLNLGFTGNLWQAQGHTVTATTSVVFRLPDVPIKYTNSALYPSHFFDTVSHHFANTAPNVSSRSFTMETWVQTDSFGGNTTPIFVVGTTGAGRNYGIFLNHGGAGLSIMTPNITNTGNVITGGLGDLGNANARGNLWVGTGQLTTGSWHHIAFTHSNLNGNLTVFLNGNVVREANIGFVNMTPVLTQNVYIGTSPDTSINNLRGWVSGAAITEGLKYTSNFTPLREPFPIAGNTLFNLNLNNNASFTAYITPANVSISAGNVDIIPRVPGRATGGSPRLDGYHSPFTSTQLRANVSPNMYHTGRAEENGLLSYQGLASYNNSGLDTGRIYTTLKPSDTSLDLGTDPFTIEAWIYPNRQNNGYGLCGKGSTTTGFSLEVGTVTTNLLTFRHGSSAITATTGAISVYSWQHIVIQRSSTGSNDFRMFVNGRLAHIDTLSTNLTDVNTIFYFLTNRTNSGMAVDANLYINNFRISKVARYPTTDTIGALAFTPSRLPLTSDNDTSLLLFNNWWTDITMSPYLDVGHHHFYAHDPGNENKTVGANPVSNKNWSVSFNTNAVGIRIYNSTTNTDGLNADSSDFAFGTGDFTWEIFVAKKSRFNNVTSTTETGYLWNCKRVNTPDDDSLAIYENHQGKICVDYGDGTRSRIILSSRSSIAGSIEKWYHIVLQRVNNRLALYINGIREAEVLFSTDMLCRNTTPCIGTQGSTGVVTQQNSNSFRGFMSNLRVLKGKAFYAVNGENPIRFEVPSDPLANDPACVLLTFNNPALIDQSLGGKNKGQKLIHAGALTDATAFVHGDYSITAFSPFKEKPKSWRQSQGIVAGYNFNGIYGYSTGAASHGWHGHETYYLGMGETPFTLEFWFYLVKVAVSGNTTYPYVFRSGSESSAWRGIQLAVHSVAAQNANRYGAVSLRTFSDTAANNILSGNEYSMSLSGTYHHIALVCDPEATNNKYAIFVDGQLRSWSGLGAQFSTDDYGGTPLEFRDGANGIVLTRRAKYSTYQPVITGIFDEKPIEAFTAFQPITTTIHPVPGVSSTSGAYCSGTSVKYVPEIGNFGRGSIAIQQQSVQNSGGFWNTTTPPYGFQGTDRIYFGWIDNDNMPEDGFSGDTYGDFTVEGWFAWRGAANPNDRYLFELSNSFAVRFGGGSRGGEYSIRWNNNDAYMYNVPTAKNAFTTSTGSSINFDHIVLQMRGGNFMLFLNGRLVYTYSVSRVQTAYNPIAPATSYTMQDDYSSTGAYLLLGGDNEQTGAKSFRGYIQDIRLSRLARYDVKVINGVSVMVHRGTNTPALPTKPFIPPVLVN